jgi:hypothetical protein
MISCLFLKASRCSNGVQLATADTFDLLHANRRPLDEPAQPALSSLRRNSIQSLLQRSFRSLRQQRRQDLPSQLLERMAQFRIAPYRARGLTPESGIQYPKGVKGWAMGSVSIRATLHLRKALQGLAASGHPFRVSFRATAQARSPCSCRKCVPLAVEYRPEQYEAVLDSTRVHQRTGDMNMVYFEGLDFGGVLMFISGKGVCAISVLHPKVGVRCRMCDRPGI